MIAYIYNRVWPLFLGSAVNAVSCSMIVRSNEPMEGVGNASSNHLRMDRCSVDMNNRYCESCGLTVCQKCGCAYNLKEDPKYIGKDKICWKCQVTMKMVRAFKDGIKVDDTVIKGEVMEKPKIDG